MVLDLERLIRLEERGRCETREKRMVVAARLYPLFLPYAFMAVYTFSWLLVSRACGLTRISSNGGLNSFVPPYAWHVDRSIVFVLIRIHSNVLLAVAVALQSGRFVVQALRIEFRTSKTVHVWIVLSAKRSIAVRTAGEARLPFSVYLYPRGNARCFIGTVDSQRVDKDRLPPSTEP